MSRGHLVTPDPDGQRALVEFDEKVQISISAYCEEMARYGQANSPVLMLKHLIVEFIFQDRKCLFHAAAQNAPGYKLKILALRVFTDARYGMFVCPVEVAGDRGFVTFTKRDLQISVSSKEMAAQSKYLLKDCITHHPFTCPPNLDVLLPSRVIDVNSNQNQEGLSLHVSAPNERAHYTALSYCWGDPPHSYVTTRSTLEDLSKVDWSQLPTTIKDAVIVTRSLGIRYLWIDALCIVQDDEMDKTEEIKVMGRIYKNATITIAAANSSGVHTGFLEDRKVPSIPLPIVKFGTDEPAGILWVHENTVDAPDEPLDQRGWTLQESLLSPRILYYGSKDLVWKCQAKPFQPVIESHALYSTNMALDQNHRLPSTIFNIASKEATSITENWAWIQSIYSQRKLSFPEDRFRALGGIVEELQRVTGDTYIAGVWKNNIVKTLAWFRPENIVGNTAPYTPLDGPSWSWITHFRPVRTLSLEEDKDKNKRLELLSWSVKLADMNAPLGHVEGGELEILGCMIQTTKIPTEIWTKESSIELLLDFDVVDGKRKLSVNFVGEEYFYLLLGNRGAATGALLLRHLGNDSFIRLGLSAWNQSKSFIWSLEDVQRMRIRLL